MFHVSNHAKTKRNSPGSALTLPVFGDLPLLIGGDLLKTFRKLRQKHGDIFSFYLGQDLTIVINGYHLVQKAAVRNGHIFSGRSNRLYANILGVGKGIGFNEGPSWKRLRKFTYSCLQEMGFGKTSMEENILKEVNCFADVLQNQNGKPFDVRETIQAGTANVIFSLVCGKRHEYEDRYYQELLNNANIVVKQLFKVSVLFSCAPILQYFPGDPFNMKDLKKKVEHWDEFLTKTYADRKKLHDRDNPQDYIDFFITEQATQEKLTETSDFSMKQLNAVGRDLFLAGSETTASVTRWALLYLLKYPDIQRRLHLDIDQVVADGKLPSLDDRTKLPYVDAFIMEVLRCADVGPFAVPHSLTTDKDVIFEGYTIPKNATIILNLDSVLQDPAVFENPSKFNPERYFGSEGDIIRPKELIPFGIGRRVCLGESVARMELFLYLTTMLKRFSFLPENESAPDMEGTLGLTYSPKPFKVRAVERKTDGRIHSAA